MKRISSSVLFSIIVSVVSNQAVAAILVECMPLGGNIVSGGQVVEIECFATTDIDQLIIGGKLDFACTLPPQPGTIGSIVSVGLTANPDGAGYYGPSSSGFQYLIPSPFGVAVLNQVTCLGAAQICGLCIAVLLPANETRYVVSNYYQVSECAAGAFNVVLEGISTPPSQLDATAFSDENNHHLPISYSPVALIVEVEACCLPDSTCEMLNATCCENQGGVSQGAGTVCDGDADGDGIDAACGDPCFGFSNDDTDGDGFCDSADNCPATSNANQADSDNDTVGDACDLCPRQDDLLDADNNFVPDCRQNIPTTSTWGIIMLAMLVLTGAKLRISPSGLKCDSSPQCIGFNLKTAIVEKKNVRSQQKTAL